MIYFLVTLIASAPFYETSGDGKKLTIRGEGIVKQEDVRGYGSHEEYESVEIYEATELSASAFAKCSKMMSIFLDNSITKIGSSCFQECISLAEVNLPNKLKILSGLTFYGCSSLTKVYFPSSVSNVLSGAFCAAKKLKYFDVSLDSKYFSTDSTKQFLLSKDGSKAIAGPGCEATINIPKNVKILCTSFLYSLPVSEIKFSEESSLTEIERSSIIGCPITSIVLPYGVQKLSSSIFKASSITSITIPDSLVECADDVFREMRVLEEVIITDKNLAMKDINGIIYNKKMTSILFISPKVTSLFISKNIVNIDYSIIRSSKNVNKIVIEENHTEYNSSEGVLYNANFSKLLSVGGGVRNVTVREECEEIVENAIYKMQIENLKFNGTKIRTIGTNSIGGTKIKQLSLPDSIERILGYSFQMCISLSGSIVFPSKLYKLGSFAYIGCNAQHIDFGKCKNLTTISDSAFSGCSSIETIVLPPNIEIIQNDCFKGSTSLEAISFPLSLSQLGPSCFQNCRKLVNITFCGNNITSLPDGVFANTGVQSIEIPDSVQSLGSGLFRRCTRLTNVSFGLESELSTLSPDVFDGCSSIKEIEFGKNLRDVRPGALSGMFGCIGFKVSKENIWYEYDENGVLYSKGFKSLIAFPGGLHDCVLHWNATSIFAKAFFECKNLITVNLDGTIQKSPSPENVIGITSIGESTFIGCSSLASLAIPASVSDIEARAFSGCTSLKRVQISSNSKLEVLSDGIFQGCVNLTSFDFGSGSILRSINASAFDRCESLTMFDFSVHSIIAKIHERAFFGCSKLKEIRLPSSIDEIGDLAFANCSLQSVRFCSSSVKVTSTAFQGSSAIALVPATYEGKKFAGLPAVSILDSSCNIPTAVFTSGVASSNTLGSLLVAGESSD